MPSTVWWPHCLACLDSRHIPAFPTWSIGNDRWITRTKFRPPRRWWSSSASGGLLCTVVDEFAARSLIHRGGFFRDGYVTWWAPDRFVSSFFLFTITDQLRSKIVTWSILLRCYYFIKKLVEIWKSGGLGFLGGRERVNFSVSVHFTSRKAMFVNIYRFRQYEHDMLYI